MKFDAIFWSPKPIPMPSAPLNTVKAVRSIPRISSVRRKDIK
jgi:hypothetical protein